LEQEYTRRLSEVATAEGWQSTKQLQSLTQKVKRSIGRLVDAYTEGLIEKEEFEPRIRQARLRLAQLEHQAQVQLEQEAQTTELKHLINGLQEFASRVQNGLEEADFPLRRQIIRTLVKQIEVGHEKVNIVYRITPSDSMTQKDSEGLQHCKQRHKPVTSEPIPTLRFR
jgi:site-specific DNA recombinase